MPTYLRLATPDDLERIAALHALSWRTAYRGIYPDDYLDNDVTEDRRAVWEDRFRTPREDQLVVLAEDGGALHGFICAYGDEDPGWGSLIDNLHVTPERKRGGIGTLLMREAASWLQERYPRSSVYLWALAANTPARRFYERLGARNAEMSEEAIPGGGTALSCRYVWPTPHALYQACSPSKGA